MIRKSISPIITRSVLFVILHLIAAFPAKAQSTAIDSPANIKLLTEIDRSIITIGDTIVYKIIVQFGSGIEVQRPEPGKDLGHFEIKDFQEGKIVQLNDSIRSITYRYVLTTFFTGTFIFPPVTIHYLSPDKQPQEISTEAQRLDVQSLGGDTAQDIRAIKPPLSVPYDYRPWYYAFGGLALLLGAGLAVWYFYRKYRKLRADDEGPAVPADVTAREALSRIGTTLLADDSRCKEFYIELSYTIRRYLEERFCVPALENPTFDLLPLLQEIDDIQQKEHYAYLEDLLDESDLVKFAKFFRVYERRRELWEKGLNFVNTTAAPLEIPKAAIDEPDQTGFSVQEVIPGETPEAEKTHVA